MKRRKGKKEQEKGKSRGLVSVLKHYCLMWPNNKYFNLDPVSRTNLFIDSFSNGLHDTLFFLIWPHGKRITQFMFMFTFSSGMSIWNAVKCNLSGRETYGTAIMIIISHGSLILGHMRHALQVFGHFYIFKAFVNFGHVAGLLLSSVQHTWTHF